MYIYIYIYISTHFLTSQPTLIKLDNENICGHLTPLHSTQTNPAFAWRWFVSDTRSRLRDVACRLLQCNPCCSSEDDNRQATMSVKRCCMSRQWHQEVWRRSGTVTTDAALVTLAGHSRASKLQAGSANSVVSAWQSTAVPIRLLHSNQPSSYTAASTLRCTLSADCTSSRHIQSAGICCRWSDDV